MEIQEEDTTTKRKTTKKEFSDQEKWCYKIDPFIIIF